jgi:membrane protease YdiL (CAAX protease family)
VSHSWGSKEVSGEDDGHRGAATTERGHPQCLVSAPLPIYASAAAAIVPLVAATWLWPSGVPLLVRQLLLFSWGVAAILLAERLLFSGNASDSTRATGFVRARIPAVAAALLVSLPMWVFLPILAWGNGVVVALRPDWLELLLGVVLVNGITEEVIHRGFVFRHLRHNRAFTRAAALSALIFAAQHLYLIITMGWEVGLSAVLLATLLAFPLAFAFERGGNSIVAPAILHTSSNAPMVVLALPEHFIGTALVPHMGVVLMSLYLVFLLRRFDRGYVPAIRSSTHATTLSQRGR